MLNSGNKIPRSLKDCYETDSVSIDLWRWSDWVKVWGERVLFVLIAIGIISTIAIVVQIAEIDEGQVFITLITSVITWTLYVFMEYCVYHVISLLLASLATIVQNTSITANVALYKTAKDEGELNAECKKPTSSVLKQNTGYSLSNLADERTNSIDYWVCKECGTKNDTNSLYCKDCGKHK